MKIYYIGNKPVKKDNLLKTNRVWAGFGASIDVPEEDAAQYLLHDSIWSADAPEDALVTSDDIGDNEDDNEGEGEKELSEEEKFTKIFEVLEKNEKGKYQNLKILSELVGFKVTTDQKNTAIEMFEAELGAEDEEE